MFNIIIYILSKMDLGSNILTQTDEWWKLVGDMHILTQATKTSNYVDDDGEDNPKMDWFDIDIINPLTKQPLIHDGGTRRYLLNERLNFLHRHTYREYREWYKGHYWMV